MEAKDIRVDESNDLMINNGDLFIGFSDPQHVHHIIYANPGFYKEFPLLGAEIDRYLNSSGKQQQLENSIRLNLESDSYKINEVLIETEAGVIDANTKISVDAIRV